ncbi:MAG: dihydropteroate synthase [Bacteroidetes bacterium]|nr:dihydropteroate synthase [Bacteroidota bacterium]
MTLNCRGQLLDLSRPRVMGILNLTPDSFYDGGWLETPDQALRQAEEMLEAGATLLDVGGASSRPGASTVETQEEIRRTAPVIARLRRYFPDAILSVDTWRAEVAQAALDAGVSMLNDISAGRLDSTLYPWLQNLPQKNLPYILMHMQGQPQNMQLDPHYQDIVTEVLDFFIDEIKKLHTLGINDILLDPGFGFGKTIAHNYALLKNLSVFETVTAKPVLVGISRKSMICKVLNVNPENALNGTTAAHMLALQQGARILRVHDVKAAIETIKIWEQWSLAT